MQNSNSPSSSADQSSSQLLRFLKSTPVILTTIVTVLGSLATIWGFIVQPFKKLDEWANSVAKKAIETEISKSASLEARINQISRKQINEILTSRDEIERYRKLSREVAIDAMQAPQGIKVIETITESIIGKSAAERKNIEFAYGFSVRFDGSEIAASKIPKNRVYFYATEHHKVRLSLYFSGFRKFPVDIRINGKPIKRNVQDIRENVDVTPEAAAFDHRPRILISTQFAPPPIDQEEEERPKDVHYLELSPKIGYIFEKNDFYYISGILIIERQAAK